MRLLLLCALVLSSAACTIYSGDDCEVVQQVGERDPETGVCVGLGRCLDDPGLAEPAIARDWATCPSACESLDEDACRAAEACRVIELACPPWADCTAPWSFHACWGVAPSGPAAERVVCESLDAYECSRRDDCVARYGYDRGGTYESPPLTLAFLACATETSPPPPSCATVDCAPGFHCEERCFPCDPAPGMECPPTPWCETACVPNPDPGACTGEVLCDALPPACPTGTLPGIRAGCWTGFCVPTWACEASPPPGA